MTEEGAMATSDAVTIPPVRAFPDARADRAQALKVLEEAAEVFSVVEEAEFMDFRSSDPDIDRAFTRAIAEECCDTIIAACNLLHALGIDDLTDAMEACERKNERRGRYV